MGVDSSVFCCQALLKIADRFRLVITSLAVPGTIGIVAANAWAFVLFDWSF